MKTLKNFFKLFVFAFFVIAFTQCSKTTVQSIGGTADITAKNLTTGESVKGKTTGNIQIGGNAPKGLSARNGDELEFTYVPQPAYAKYQYNVTFKVFNSEKKVSGNPYTVRVKVENIKADDYYLRCDAVCDSDDAEIEESAGLYINVIE